MANAKTRPVSAPSCTRGVTGSLRMDDGSVTSTSEREGGHRTEERVAMLEGMRARRLGTVPEDDKYDENWRDALIPRQSSSSSRRAVDKVSQLDVNGRQPYEAGRPVRALSYKIIRVWSHEKRCFELEARPDHYIKVKSYGDNKSSVAKAMSFSNNLERPATSRADAERSLRQSPDRLRPFSAPNPTSKHTRVSWYEMPTTRSLLLQNNSNIRQKVSRPKKDSLWRRHHDLFFKIRPGSAHPTVMRRR